MGERGRFVYFLYFILFFFLYNALTTSWYGSHNRARLQIKCALGGGDSPQHYFEEIFIFVGFRLVTNGIQGVALARSGKVFVAFYQRFFPFKCILSRSPSHDQSLRCQCPTYLSPTLQAPL